MTARGLSLKSQASVWVVSPSWPVVSPRTHNLSVVRPCQPLTALGGESEPPHFYVIFGRTVGFWVAGMKMAADYAISMLLTVKTPH